MFPRAPEKAPTYSYRRSSVLWGVGALHLVQALLLMISADADGATGVHSITTMVGGRYPAAIALAVCSLLGLWAVAARHENLVLRLCLLLPQQFLLSFVAMGALIAMASERYADGVLRPAPFIIADQLPSVAMFLMHLYALVRGARWP